MAQKFYGESAELSVLREGQLLELQLEELHPQVALVPVHLFNTKHQARSRLEVLFNKRPSEGSSGISPLGSRYLCRRFKCLFLSKTPSLHAFYLAFLF